MKSDIKLFVPKKVSDQIKYLCEKINNVEWSGIVYYKIDGDLQNDPDNTIITLKDVFPLNKGTVGSTENDYENKNLIKFKMSRMADFRNGLLAGYIHSHHTMDAYFSSVDMSDLESKTPEHVQYLSVIVNNFGNYVAKIAYPKEVFTSGVETYKIRKGNEWIEVGSKHEINTKHLDIISHDLNIEFEENAQVEDWFKNQTEQIIKDAKKVSFNPKKQFTNNNWRNDRYSWDMNYYVPREGITNENVKKFISQWISDDYDTKLSVHDVIKKFNLDLEDSNPDDIDAIIEHLYDSFELYFLENFEVNDVTIVTQYMTSYSEKYKHKYRLASKALNELVKIIKNEYNTSQLKLF